MVRGGLGGVAAGCGAADCWCRRSMLAAARDPCPGGCRARAVCPRTAGGRGCGARAAGLRRLRLAGRRRWASLRRAIAGLVSCGRAASAATAADWPGLARASCAEGWGRASRARRRAQTRPEGAPERLRVRRRGRPPRACARAGADHDETGAHGPPWTVNVTDRMIME